MHSNQINDLFNNSPKQFCTNVYIAQTGDALLMAVLSGQAAQVFAFTPQHMKALSQSLAYNIAEFEKKNGTIKAEWKPGIESPLKPSDFKK